MKTPLQKAIECLESELKMDDGSSWFIGIRFAIDQCKFRLPEEKQMVIDAYDNGYTEGNYGYVENGEQYFNETYETQRPHDKG